MIIRPWAAFWTKAWKRSYWLYLAHLPVVIAMQAVISDWPLPATLKLSLLSAVLTGFLLLTYDKLVRYTWVGKLLNGARKRPETPKPINATSEVSASG